MIQYSYSRVSLFEDCPHHFKLRYIDELTELPNYDAANALTIGKALHTGIEHDVQTAIDYYYNSFPVITDRIIEEAMKLEILIPKVHEFLEASFPDCEFIHEYELDFDNYKGFVDLIIRAPDGSCMVMDFKYSNNVKNYLDSGQLHIYKDYLEQDGFNVEKLAYLFVPKCSIKQKENEDLFYFRKRIIDEVSKAELKLIPIEFDEMQIVYFMNSIRKIETAKTYPKNVSGNCFSCMPKFRPNYLELITDEKGEVLMALPKNERRERQIDTKPDFWIYGDSYIGKSTFVDGIENVLFLNTDGNTDNTTAPVKTIKDIVKKEGRRTNRTLAWEVFLETIDDLESEDNDFEAVAIDLIEDLKEHCRIYVFEKNGWEHESDGGYGKGWDRVRTEWQKAIKRLKALGYQLIYISKERKEEINLKGGGKRTTFHPNIDDKFANFLTGTVDLTMRAFADGEERLLQLGKKGSVFGGGRFDFKADTCLLDVEEFIEELKDAQKGIAKKSKEKRKVEKDTDDDEAPRSSRRRKPDPEPEPEEDDDENETDEGEEKPRSRRSRKTDDEEDEPEERPRTRRNRKSDDEHDEQPKHERRKRNDADDEEEEKPRESKRRKRSVEDDETPPGEESSTEESSTRRRRTRR